MGLSKRRIKQKFGLDPRGARWSNDKTKYGQRLLEKFGWKEGKGLGVNEDGIKKHLSLKFKNDKLGVGGDKRASENWLENSIHYSKLLASLHEKMVICDDTSVESSLKSINCDKISDSPKFGRLYHRKKFQRNKQVSNYNASDLKRILGAKSELKTTEEGGLAKSATSFSNIIVPSDIDSEDVAKPILTPSGLKTQFQAFRKSQSLYISDFDVNVAEEKSISVNSCVNAKKTSKPEIIRDVGEQIRKKKKNKPE